MVKPSVGEYKLLFSGAFVYLIFFTNLFGLLVVERENNSFVCLGLNYTGLHQL